MDLTNAQEFERSLAAAAGYGGPLVLDLTRALYLDSHGLRVVQQLVDRHVQGGLSLSVVAPPGSIARSLLEVTALGRQVPLLPGLED